MIVFFDTNILLDIALKREPFFAPSQNFLTKSIATDEPYLSWHTISNLSYLIEKIENKETANEFILSITKVCRIAPVAHRDLAIAFDYDCGDFEDAMQIASALSCEAEYIVTRDASGFQKSPIPLLSPSPETQQDSESKK